MTNRPSRSVAAVCAAALLACVAASWGGAAALAGGNPTGAKVDPPKPVKTFPVTDVIRLKTTKDPLLALRGRVVLLTIIETYNDHCAAAVKDLNDLHDHLGPGGLTVLGLAKEEEKAKVEEWVKTTGFKGPAVVIDTATFEGLVQREFAAPGYPWSFVIDAQGNLCRHDHPSGLKEEWITPLLEATTQAPVLPESLADAQKLLDDGTWSKAREALQAAAAGGSLSKVDAGWAKGVSRWIEMRRAKSIPEGEALEKQAWWWDAWFVYDDFTRRFEGLEGCDVAKAKADAVRANKEAELDLKNGDDLAKAKEHIAKGKYDPARLILQRLAKLKTTRFGERAKELLETVPKK